MIGAVSAKGWIHKLIRPKSIKATDVLLFFKQLRQKVEGKVAVIVDNASIHRAAIVKDYCEANEIRLCFLPAYTPEL